MFMQAAMNSLTCWQDERGCLVSLRSPRAVIAAKILDTEVATVIAELV